ncbi:MAG: D-tyrosyl-tRNA(Tyr) deacylase [Chitinophagaceae bacterium]|nr:D-tyrosyl-tRNA(Tyr) deacylase [Chitinophagaceae bacterium]MCW5915424.1 D-tyrosyl-tRNA(Tyr) deacylase [Chitinophagaceae bacterium]MCZ2397674.1 D-tyrosyl-tRNA(Tyr) deacylase [Chitinophagales bacterium]
MRVVIQRVVQASVTIDQKVKSAIGKGLLVFVGIEHDDTQEDIEWIARKIVNLRVFDDESHVPNLSLQDINGDILLISQFTLHAMVKKGNRPSYIRAARPEVAIPIYNKLIDDLQKELGKPIGTGTFGAEMQIALINDGPLTIWIDSKNKE